MVGTQSYRAARLVRNTRTFAIAVGAPFVLVGAIVLVVNLRADRAGDAVLIAAITWSTALVIGTSAHRIKLAGRIVIDHDQRTVSVKNYSTVGSRSTFTFSALEEGGYELQPFLNSVCLVGWRQGQPGGKAIRERVQVDALSLMFPFRESDLHTYDDLPKPFNAPGLELEPWTETSWSDSFLRAILLRR